MISTLVVGAALATSPERASIAESVDSTIYLPDDAGEVNAHEDDVSRTGEYRPRCAGIPSAFSR